MNSTGPIKTLQINLNRSATATESALNLAIELEISLIAVQEPWVYPDPDNNYLNTRSVIYQGYIQLLPNHGILRPRTMFYIARSISQFINISEDSPDDPDCLIIDINQGSKIQIINLYNKDDLNSQAIKTLNRGLLPNPLYKDSIVLGDLNIHHPWWDPLHKESQGAQDLLEWISDNNLILLNNPGEGTFYRSNMEHPSVIDLTLITPLLENRISDWQTIQDLGSDHFGIIFNITTINSRNTTNNSTFTRFNTKLADWELFKKTLIYKIAILVKSTSLADLAVLYKQAILEGPNAGISTQKMDIIAEALTNAIIETCTISIPRATVTEKSKL